MAEDLTKDALIRLLRQPLDGVQVKTLMRQIMPLLDKARDEGWVEGFHHGRDGVYEGTITDPRRPDAA